MPDAGTEGPWVQNQDKRATKEKMKTNICLGPWVSHGRPHPSIPKLEQPMTVKHDDLQCLNARNFLNENLISGFLRYLDEYNLQQTKLGLTERVQFYN
jgi:Ulp1 family protease